MLEGDTDMSEIRAQEMPTDILTEAQLSEKSVVKMESETDQYEGNSEVSGSSSRSLYSLSESVSITISDYDISTTKEKEAKHFTEWDAADKEYMGFYNDEGCNVDIDCMEHNQCKEFIDVLDSSEVMNGFSLPQSEDPKEEPDISAANAFHLTTNIFQSEGEHKIQKQNWIRSRIQEETRRCGQADDRDSGIFDTGRFDNTDQLYKEPNPMESKNTSETKGHYLGSTQRTIQGSKPLENKPEPQLEQQDKIQEDLEDLEELIQCHLALANGTELDEKENNKDGRGDDSIIRSDMVQLDKMKNKHETDLENQFNSLLQELISNMNSYDMGFPNLDEMWSQSPPDRRLETEIKFNVFEDDSIKTTPGDKPKSKYIGSSQDASTQTEKVKNTKRCQIM